MCMLRTINDDLASLLLGLDSSVWPFFLILFVIFQPLRLWGMLIKRKWTRHRKPCKMEPMWTSANFVNNTSACDMSVTQYSKELSATTSQINVWLQNYILTIYLFVHFLQWGAWDIAQGAGSVVWAVFSEISGKYSFESDYRNRKGSI